MARRGYGQILLSKPADDFQNLFVQPKVFRSAAARQEQPGIVRRINGSKVRIESKTMSRLFRIGLIAFEIVDCRFD